MYVKIHDAGQGRLITALCDKELVGKTLKKGDVEVEIKESFYKGEELSEQRLKDILKESKNLNIFGEKAIKIALDCGVITEDSILDIAGVPHVQAVS